MGLPDLADRATRCQVDTRSTTREETPRRFHIRRTAAVAILAVVALLVPLGPGRIFVSVVLIGTGLVMHAIQQWAPNENKDGATQWVIVASGIVCSAILPVLLPAAAIASASDISGSSRTFSRRLNYLWIAVTALGHSAIGFASDTPYWPVLVATFLVATPGSVELGVWRSERSEIEQRRVQMLSELGQAVTWELLVENDELLWVDGPIEELIGVTPERFIKAVNSDGGISPLAGYPGEGKRWVIEVPHVDGTIRWFKVNGLIRTRADGAEILSGVSVDITDVELARRHEKQRAEHDALTGLANRAGLAKFLDDEAHRVGRAVLVADIDRFKDINDTLGHLVGDRLISAAAGRLDRLSSQNRLVARLGGDEFAIAVVGDSSEQVDAEAETIAVEVARVLNDGFSVQDIELHISASIGIASGSDLDWPELLRRADGSMYEAKREASRYKWYDRDTDDDAIDQLRMQADLTKGLEDEIELHYQPVVCANSQQIIGVEALARWFNAERGQVFPDTFLPIIEKSGMTSRFDMHVLRTAVAAASEMAITDRPVTVSVNLSPRSLLSPTLLVQLRELLAEHPLARDRIVVEVTEQGLTNDFSRSLPVLESLRELGVRLSLDDFGTGGSSLIRLRSLPFDEIKIDRSFVNGVPGDGIDATIVESTIELAGALGMSTVAEGVETLDQAAALAAMGCTKLQGWAFSKAMPLDELFEEWINTQAPNFATPESN